MRCRLVFPALLATLTIALNGCGGGGSDNSAPAIQTANAHVTVNWAARTRNIDAPASAQSLTITLKNASPTGTDVAFTVNRDAAPAAYEKSYSSPVLAKVGTWDLNARFYAQPNGAGSVVGTIDAQINLAADGTGIGDFATTGTVASVVVAPNQTMPIGVPTDVIFTAKDTGGADLAISPGSAKVTVTQGTDKLQIDSQGRANGTAVGTAKVTATVDGKTSPEQDISVGYNTSVTITPATATLFANGQQGFEFKVSGVPDNQGGVTWSVQEGDAGGTVSGGSYVAPNTPGTYHVVAASSFDATKRAIATITVTGPTSSNAAGIYVLDSGNSRLVHADDVSGAAWSAASHSGLGFAIGPDGKIYFAEGSQISRTDNLSSSNRISFGSGGSGQGHFGNASSIAVGADGKIYVVDSSLRRLIRFDDMSGANWVELSANSLGVGSLQSVQVVGGHIYFWGQNSVVSIDDMQGNGRKVVGGGGTTFFVDSNSKLYIASGSTLTRYDDFDGNGAVQFGAISGSGTGQFNNLSSVWVASNGQIYVVDKGNNRIVRMDDMAGKNWTTLGSLGISNNQFANPAQIVVR